MTRPLPGALCAAAAALLGACSITAPINGTFEDGDKFAGAAVASLTGGSIDVAAETGLACRGTYDPFDRSRRLSVALDCDDGQTARADIVRNADLQSGRGRFTLSGGRSGTFTFAAES
jgi:hypothetical protein